MNKEERLFNKATLFTYDSSKNWREAIEKDIEDEISSWSPEKREYFNKEAQRLIDRARELLDTAKEE